MSTINNPLIKSSVFQSGSNQGNDSFLSMENGDFDINQLLNKNAVQSPNLSNNNSYLEKLNKNLTVCGCEKSKPSPILLA